MAGRRKCGWEETSVFRFSLVVGFRLDSCAGTEAAIASMFFVGQAWVGEEQLQGLLEPKPAPRTSIAYQAFDVFLLLLPSIWFVYCAIVELDLSLWLGDGGY